jgi:hypothetical protein
MRKTLPGMTVLILISAVFLLTGCGGGELENVAAPVFDPEAGTFDGPVDVTITTATEGAAIYYSTGDTPPDPANLGEAVEYTEVITVASTTTINAVAIMEGMNPSEIVSAAYVIDASKGQVATPVFSPEGGDFTTVQEVTITCDTEGATIYYTEGDTPPDTEDLSGATEYTGAITLKTTTTLNAVAVKTDMLPSASAAQTYTIDLVDAADPVFDPAGGTYTSSQSVTLSTATAGASIYYTTGTDLPSPSDLSNATLYESEIIVTADLTINAIAVKDGMDPSAVVSEFYDIEPVPNDPPTANAGSDMTVYLGNRANLTGSATDPEDGAMTYEWTFQSTASGSNRDDSDITDADKLNARFYPDVTGDYVLKLTVSDGPNTVSDTVTVTAAPSNAAPTASLSASSSVLDAGTGVTLTASGTDADGESLDYTWSLEKPAGSGASAPSDAAGQPSGTEVTPSVTLDAAGEYTFTFTVTDGKESDTESVTVTAVEDTGGNEAPVANAGPDATVNPSWFGYDLDGSGSGDVDGTITYDWQLTDFPPGSNFNTFPSDEESPTIDTMATAGEYTFTLTVTDDGGPPLNDTDTVVITINESAPSVDSFEASPGTVNLDDGISDLISLHASYTDMNGDDLVINFSFDSTPAASGLTDGDITVNMEGDGEFTPDVIGQYVVRVTASDGTADDSMTVSVTAYDNSQGGIDVTIY